MAKPVSETQGCLIVIGIVIIVFIIAKILRAGINILDSLSCN